MKQLTSVAAAIALLVSAQAANAAIIMQGGSSQGNGMIMVTMFDGETLDVVKQYDLLGPMSVDFEVDSADTYTLEEVGRIFKVTRERVRQIEAKAVRKLQHLVRSEKLAGVLKGAA